MTAVNGESVFNCRMCGHCCEGRGGIVVSPTDMVRLAAHMQLPPEQALALEGAAMLGRAVAPRLEPLDIGIADIARGQPHDPIACVQADAAFNVLAMFMLVHALESRCG